MPTLISDPQDLRKALLTKAHGEGFSAIAITDAHLGADAGNRLETSIANGWNGTMGWLAETAARRRSPDVMWGEAQTAILFAMSYAQDLDPMARLLQKSDGVISVYALNRDYHDVVKGKLKRIAQWFATTSKHQVKVFVDTAPLMEKPLGEKAGLGWQGKHTNLVSRQLGSWFFIGTMLTTYRLEVDDPETDHCGTCTACLDICPTQAFPAPRMLDARKCISYLTIEHHGMIDVAFRRAMGNRIFGCDDCLAVCPWNKFASAAQEIKLKARTDLVAPSLAALLQLDEAQFRKMFSGSPVKRIGHHRFIRNCLVAAGNSNDSNLVAPVTTHLNSASDVIRATAVWALRELLPAWSFNALRQAALPGETAETVREEWRAS